MNKLLLYILAWLIFPYNFISDKNERNQSGVIPITWVDNLKGDFSFAKNWDYPEGVYKNEFGQLSCDGNCPPGIEAMKDENGKIYSDSLRSFYKLVDTTHLYHTIKSEAFTKEWVGTNTISIQKINKDSVICFTHTNVATHSSLYFTLARGKCIATIQLFSISRSKGMKLFTCKSGEIQIDRGLWRKGTLKANFNFIFHTPTGERQAFFWRGKILARIVMG